MYGYIYLTTNTLDGMKYIGKRKGFFTPSYLGSGIRLKNAVRYHGRKAFTVVLLEKAESPDELDSLEMSAIMEFDAVKSPDFYNLADGGSGGLTYHDRSRHVLPHMRKAAAKYAGLQEMLKYMSQAEAAKILGVDQSAIAQRIKKHNLKIDHSDEYHVALHVKRAQSAKLAQAARRQKAAERWKAHDIAAMYKTMTQKEIAEKVGVSQVRVSQYIREHKITK